MHARNTKLVDRPRNGAVVVGVVFVLAVVILVVVFFVVRVVRVHVVIKRVIGMPL